MRHRRGSGMMSYYFLLVGNLEFEKGHIKKAKKAYKESLRISSEVMNYPPSQADALVGIAMCNNELGQKTLAKRHFEKALRLNPNLTTRGYV
jgi:tetratricopeptide (TPR) repeat protein